MRCFARACRFVFHKALALQTANHAAGNKFIGYVEMANLLPLSLWKVEFAWLREAPSQALLHSLNLSNEGIPFCGKLPVILRTANFRSFMQSVYDAAQKRIQN